MTHMTKQLTIYIHLCYSCILLKMESKSYGSGRNNESIKYIIDYRDNGLVLVLQNLDLSSLLYLEIGRTSVNQL